MTEGAVAKVKDPVYAVVQSGRAASKVGHKYLDCSTARGESLEALNQREAGLLGLRECSVCVKRASGGPAYDTLASILQGAITDLEKNGFGDFQADQAAYHVIEQLKERGFYIAQRTKKGAADAD